MSGVDKVAARLAKLGAAVRRRIAVDPFAAVREDFGRDLVEIDDPHQRGEDGSCDGFSFLDAGVIYYRSTWSDRQFFTVVHELAHELVEQDDDTIDWITLAKYPGMPMSPAEASANGIVWLVTSPDAKRLLHKHIYVPDLAFRNGLLEGWGGPGTAYTQ